jgi:hypothetical protein
VASHSPVGLEADSELDGSYVDGWQKITGMMDSGSSWSGREHNCAYLNLGQRSFVDISVAAGLDHIQDGRAVAQLDWDGDGDLDLWLKSRNGQQLRLLENTRTPNSDYVSVRLRGTFCNEDAIGARVELRAEGKTHHRELRCGEGYMAQSTGELVFGLDGAKTIDELLVHWPGGATEVFDEIQPGSRLRLVQGEGRGAPLVKRELKLDPQAELPTLPAASRIVLRTPLPLPTAFQQKFFSPGEPQARLINLWATWCAPCVEELGEFARHSDELLYAGLELIPVCLDAEEDPSVARAFFEGRISPLMIEEAKFESAYASEEDRLVFEVLLKHLIAKSGDMPVPASLLVDKNGMVAVLYLGPVSVDTLIEDIDSFGVHPESIGVRSSYPGRWFYGMPRNLDALGKAFRKLNLGPFASFYSALHGMMRRQQ